MQAEFSPRLSIGLPVYNGETYLAETLDGLLQQTYSNFELIISDNASSDRTEEICRNYSSRDERIRYVRYEENLGAAWNFNNAFHLSKGEYFKWAAHDDLHEPTFLQRCMEVMDDDPSVALCFTQTIFIDDCGQHIKEYPFPIDLSAADKRDVFRFYTQGGHIVHEIFGVIRSSVLRETPLIGGYVGSDLVLLGKLALVGQFHQVPEKLFMHREHPDRSAIATAGVEGFTQWYDPAKSGRFVVPYWRRIVEHAKSVAQSPLRVGAKARSMWDICKTANWNRSELAQDLVRIVKSLPK